MRRACPGAGPSGAGSVRSVADEDVEVQPGQGHRPRVSRGQPENVAVSQRAESTTRLMSSPRSASTSPPRGSASGKWKRMPTIGDAELRRHGASASTDGRYRGPWQSGCHGSRSCFRWPQETGDTLEGVSSQGDQSTSSTKSSLANSCTTTGLVPSALMSLISPLPPIPSPMYSITARRLESGDQEESTPFETYLGLEPSMSITNKLLTSGPSGLRKDIMVPSGDTSG